MMVDRCDFCLNPGHPVVCICDPAGHEQVVSVCDEIHDDWLDRGWLICAACWRAIDLSVYQPLGLLRLREGKE
jgi:hypothetical protein